MEPISATLTDIRNRINGLDLAIASLIYERAIWSLHAQAAKPHPIDEAREQEVINTYLDQGLDEQIPKAILAYCRGTDENT